MHERNGQDKPKAYHHGDLRNALIQAGLELLSQGGANVLDLRRVARMVGVSHAAPYRHFADKQALIAALMEEGFYQLTERIQTALRELPEDPFEQLYGVAQAYISFAHENPWLMREMYSGLTVEREAYPGLQKALKTVYRLYVEVIERGQAKGAIIEGDPRALAGVLWSMMHGVATLVIENQMQPYADGQEGIERVTRFSLQMLYSGLKRK